MIPAGYSDKYGQIWVERVGNTGFDDPSEPVALLRAQDEFALYALERYQARLDVDSRVPLTQAISVHNQVNNFKAWRKRNAGRIRVPGTRADRSSKESDDQRT